MATTQNAVSVWTRNVERLKAQFVQLSAERDEAIKAFHVLKRLGGDEFDHGQHLIKLNRQIEMLAVEVHAAEAMLSFVTRKWGRT